NYNNPYTAGMSTGNNSGIFEDNVLSTYIWAKKAPQEFEIDGLEPNKVYSFVFAGSYKWKDAVSAYQIGNQVATLVTSQNTTNTVSIDNVKSDANGAVKIKLYGGENSSYAMLNGMIIRSMSHAVAVPTDLKA